MLKNSFSCFRLSIALIAVLLCYSNTRAQDLAFRHYTVEDGLASATVYSCIQDNKGYLWFSTESGVNRFNGKKFTLFTVDDGLADSEVFSIYQDKLNRIWFLTYNGQFTYFLKDKFYNGENKPFLKNAYCGQSLTGVKEDKYGRLWFSSAGNYVILIDGEKVVKFKFSLKAHAAGGVDVFIRSDGIPEFRYNNKVFVYQESRQQIRLQKTGFFNYYFQLPTRSETAASTRIVREGIIIKEGNRERLLIPQPNDEILAFFTTVYHEKNDLFWVGTLKSGLYLYALQNDSVRLVKQYLPEIQVNNLTKDHEGNLWVCTKEEGVFMLPAFGRHTFVYTESENFLTSNIYSVFGDSRGRIWTGGEKGYVTCLDSTGAVIRNYKLAQLISNDNRVVEIAEDSASNIWVATSFSIYKINESGEVSVITASKKSMLHGPRAGKSITVTSKGDVYLAFYAGVVKYNRQMNTFDLLEHQGYPTRTFYVFSWLNRLLVANINGLCEYKNDSLVPLYNFDMRLRKRISCIQSINDSIALIATNGHGVFVYRNDTIVQHITVNNGLPSNDCKSLYVEGNNLWVVTVKGLAKFQLINDQLVVRDITNILNGIYSSDIRKIIIKRGKIYSATSRGLIVLDGLEYMKETQGPPVLFLSMEANNARFSLDSLISLRHSQNNISVTFEAISFNNPGRILYEYRLKENAEKWDQTHANELAFSWLPPGTHELLVRAKIANGNWGPPSALNFTISKPFWETYIFRFLFIVIFLGMVSLPFYMYYKRRIRNRWLELDKLAAVNRERQRISYDLHDDLGSALTSIKMNAEIIKQKKRTDINFNKELDDLTVYANEANEKMSDIVWAVSVSKDNLSSLASYINEFITDFDSRTGIKCVKKIQEKLPPLPMRPEARKNIFLIVKEAFHNIQKHSGASEVVFELFVSNHILNISIRDNGKGFIEDGILDSSVGLTSMRKRMESIAGEFIIVTKMNVGTDVMLRYNLVENASK